MIDNYNNYNNIRITAGSLVYFIRVYIIECKRMTEFDFNSFKILFLSGV